MVSYIVPANHAPGVQIGHDRNMWRSGVRSAMHAASQLSGRGPTDVDVALYMYVNQKSDYDDDIFP